jgi:hypothetical protein
MISFAATVQNCFGHVEAKADRLLQFNSRGIESSFRLAASIKAGPSYRAAMYPTLKLEILEL